MEIREIAVGTSAYEAMKSLRWNVLLNPINVPITYIDPEREKNDLLIGAFDGDALIGCCILSKRDGQTLQLRQMAVASALQKKGVGASILRHCEALARSLGYTRLMMHARDAVMDFYAKCGYAVASDQFFEVNIPHHVMEKKWE